MEKLWAFIAGIITSLCDIMHHTYSWLRYHYIRQRKLHAQPELATEATITDLRDEDVLYRSEHFIVVNKRSDVVINSDDPKHPVSLAKQIAFKYPEAVDPTLVFHFRFLHRLDYATSGAIAVALTKKGAQWGSKAFLKRYVTKHYLALARGHMDPLKFQNHVIESPIGRDSSVTDVCIMCSPEKNPAYCSNPRSASTQVVLLEHGTYDGDPASKLLLIPNTGRTHQLRVHLSEAGYPIVGDYTYSRRNDVRPHRMMLHAHRLVIPMKHEHIDVLALDTFIPEHDPLWRSGKTFETYEGYVQMHGLRTNFQPAEPTKQKNLVQCPSSKPKQKVKQKPKRQEQAENLKHKNHCELSGNDCKLSGNHSELSGNYSELSENCSELSGNHSELSGNHSDLSGNHSEPSGNSSELLGNHCEDPKPPISSLEPNSTVG